MDWKHELDKLLSAYETVHRELERKATESQNSYLEGSKDAYDYIIHGLRGLLEHARQHGYIESTAPARVSVAA